MQRDEPRCTDCSQRHKGLFCNLAGATLSRLDEVKNIEHYKAGDVIFYEGQKPRALFCVYSGRVKVFKVGHRDEEQVISLLGPANLTGYRSILAGESYAATAEAIEPSTLCAFPPQMIFELVRESGDFTTLLLARLAKDLRLSQEYMMVRTQESVRQRTARVLVWFLEGAELGQVETQHDPTIRARRGEIARIVSTTPETLSRVLRELAGKGYLRLSRNDIVAVNMAALRRIASGSPPMAV